MRTTAEVVGKVVVHHFRTAQIHQVFHLDHRLRDVDDKRALLASGAALAVALAVFGGRAISPQDKYTLQVRGGLASSEFMEYEGWPVIAISENEGKIAVIVGNTVMIDAYKEGVPGNGKRRTIRRRKTTRNAGSRATRW